jgi:23S rRNA (uridine2552-2'-O)-methyltransferase
VAKNRGAAGVGDGQRRGNRMKTKVKTARGRTISSTRWLERQLNDPYVAAAQKDGYRSRAAYKIIELDDRYGLFKPGGCVIDLGSAPGGWAQIAAQRVGAVQAKGLVAAIDIQHMEPVQGVDFLELDFLADEAPEKIQQMTGRRADTVISDMAAAVTGHRQTDHLRTMALAEAAAWFAFDVLKPGGSFCAKVFQGGTSRELLKELKTRFGSVHHMKPKSSRKESVELYVVALDFKGPTGPLE